MSDPHRDRPEDAPLNPALKSRTETVYETKSTTPAPFDTASAKEGEGESWPIIWLLAALAGVILAVWFLIN